jgi:hypothetical protein
MSGQHALRHPWRKWVIFSVALALAAVPWFLGGQRAGASPTSAPRAVAAAEDACALPNQNWTPLGDCGPFDQLYRENFDDQAVPLGAFSNCAGDGDHRCEGLRTAYPRYYGTLGAYPDGWADTATSGNDGNEGRTFGGYYRPQDTTSVIEQSNGDGQLRVRMWRGSSGAVHSAAPVPTRCMDLRYGKFTERMVIRTLTNGYKAAHLHYSPDEIDYPEAGGNFASDPVSVFTHGFAESGKDVAPNSAWASWHTYSTEITPNRVKIYFDGKLVQTINGDYPRATPWVLQNESALAGGYAAPNSSVVIDSSWLTCYSYAP